MPEFFEKYFTQKEKEKSPEEIKEEKALALAEEIKEIKERMEKEGETLEGYQKIIELAHKIEKLYKKEIIGWEKEGKLTKKDVLAKYQAGSWVQAANFSPEGDKIVIGSEDGTMRVIG